MTMELAVNRLANVFERIASAPDTLPTAMEMEGVVRDLFRRVHHKMQDAELLEAIHPMVRKKDYKPAIVSSWRNGPAMPPAEVILAVALVTQTSLDELLFGESLQDKIAQPLAQEIDELRRDQAVHVSTLKEILQRLDALGVPSIAPLDPQS